MFNFGTFFLWALAVFVLWRGSLADTGVADIETKAKLESLVDQEAGLRGQLEEVRSKLDGQLREVNAKLEEVEAKLEGLEAKLEGQLQDVKAKLEAKLEGQQTVLINMTESQTKLEGNLLAVQTSLENKLQAVLNQLQAVSTTIKATIIPFEKIGTRYFKIVNEKVDWITAERRCREMGGYLAAFQNEEEINAVTQKIKWGWTGYWLGLNDRDSEGRFVSVASNKPAKFFKWSEGQPDNLNNNQNCVILFRGKMWDDNSNNNYYFICQADNET